jgi:C1A family cysteine protease
MTFKLKPNGKIHFSMNEFKSRFLLRTNVTNKIRTKLSQLSMSLKKHPKTESELIVNMPIEIDWVKKGMVTPVRDQKSCGCCYAFSTVNLHLLYLLIHNFFLFKIFLFTYF